MMSYMNWSGGKDSALCLHKALRSKQYKVLKMLTSVNAVHDRISMHGVRRSLLKAQVQSIGFPLKTIELPDQPGMKEYEEAMIREVIDLKQLGCTHALFGDIYLEDLRTYREKQLREMEITCAFPLWKMDTRLLAKEFIDLGFKSIIVCVNEKYLDKSFCGRILDNSFLEDLPADVDPCGENGEFHSFVFDGPIFKQSIPFVKGELVYRKYQAPKNNSSCHSAPDPAQYGFYFQDLLPL